MPPPTDANTSDSNLDEPPITEPPQNIDQNPQAKHDKFHDGPVENAPSDDIDRNVIKLDQESNALDTSTSASHPKNTKKHKNNGSINCISNFALMTGVFVWMSFHFAR